MNERAGDNVASGAIEMWGGVECTVNRVHDRWFDQVVRSGHDLRIDDLDRFAALGIKAIRYPLLWERLAPRSLDDIDWRWSDARLGRLRELDIRPIVGLVHHGSGPAYTSLVDPAFPDMLATIARAVAARYPWVMDFTPINEPLTTARFSGLYGHWYPHGRSNRTFVRTLLTQIRGIVLAMGAVRDVTPEARLIQTEDCGRAFGTPATARQRAHEDHRRWLTWDLLNGAVVPSHPLYGWLLAAGATQAELAWFGEAPCPPDILGLNYYLTSDRYLDANLARYPAMAHGGNDSLRYADVEAVRARPEGIAGHEAHLVAAWERYRIPLALTEVHLACTREEQVRWLVEAWRGAHAARARGARVGAITPWALLGSYDWSSLVTVDAGEYEPGAFDVRGPAPRPTALAAAIKSLASAQEPAHPAFDGAGWWRRPERLIYTAAPRRDGSPAAGRPLLIFGATGTLGRAFERICSTRGLRTQLVSRAGADITQPAAIDAVIRHSRPWAVINAAGYVRVDEAETEREACWRANVRGPVTLAAACRRRGIPFVTFSSDLVFDGHAGRPYTEEDEPRPLNLYGESKAEAERRVLDLLPDALVIRTSAFFGPWDDANFLTALLRALDAGEDFVAPADTTVSPTYVPHLVNAAIDLLIDGERGLWHLSNIGRVTWFDFASRAAALCGLPVGRIQPAATSRVWGPAIRPHDTTLASVRGAVMPPLDDGLAAWLAALE
jgi:dTDP-4-dehydrorhamnose reductase